MEQKTEDSRKYVHDLIKKAAESDRSVDALQLSQAACNAANAIAALRNN